jgi:hypothetical protein
MDSPTNSLEKQLLDNKITIEDYLSQLGPQYAQMIGVLKMTKGETAYKILVNNIKNILNYVKQANLDHISAHISALPLKQREAVQQQMLANMDYSTIGILIRDKIQSLYEELKKLINEGRAQIRSENV